MEAVGAPCRGGSRNRPYTVRYDFCRAEVQNLGLPTRGGENVRWLDITMSDPFGMRRVQAVSNLNGKIEQRFDW
jgi:hypothetical protein